MNDSELASILQSIDAALDVYRAHPGKLSTSEVSVKSLLSVLRKRVAEQLSQQRDFAESK